MRLQRDDGGVPPRGASLSGGSAGDPLALRVEIHDGLPTRLLWRRRRYKITTVQPLACVQGRWWLDWQRGGQIRRTFLVTLEDDIGQSFNAELTKQGALWKLTKIYD